MPPESWVLPAVILLPLVAVPFASLFSGSRLTQAWLGLSVIEFVVLLSLFLVSQVLGKEPITLPLATATVLGVEFRLVLVADGLSALFLLLLALVAGIGALFNAGPMASAANSPYQQPVLLLAMSVLAAVFVSGNLLTLYLFWQLAVLCFALVLMTGLGEGSFSAGAKFVIVNEVSALLILFVLGLAYSRGGEPTVAGLLASNSAQLRLLGPVLLTAAGLLAAAVVPLHTWFATAGEGLTPALA
nr:hypothetical protein [Dehalococcoidales bacterium]